MKLRNCFPAALMFVLVISITSCKKNNTEGRYIPASAHAVVHINLKSLSAKLPWSEIKNNPFFKEAHDTDSVWIKNLLDSPAISGIDTDKEIIFFVQKENNGGYVAVEGNIKDATAFKTFCSQMSGNKTISENDGISYISYSPSCIGWNAEKFIYIVDAPHLQRMDDLHRRMKRDSIDITDHTPRNVSATCKSIFDLEEKNSLAVNERFSALVKEQGDLHIWINTEDFYKDVKLEGVFAVLNLEKIYKESVATASVNFENGSIKINAHNYSNKELAKVFEKFSGGKVNEEMLKKIPGNDVAAALAINFKPEALLEIAKVINLDGLVNGAERVTGFNTNDFIKANKGDIVFGLSDFKIVNDSINSGETDLPFAVTRPKLNPVFAVSVSDKNSFDKLVAAGSKAASWFINTKEHPFFYSYNNNYFALSTSQTTADAFMNTPSNNNRDFVNKIAGSPVGGYCNLQSFLKGFETLAAKDSSSMAIYDASLKLWDNILLKGGEFGNGALNYTIEINMLNKSINSLQQLNQYVTLIGEITSLQKRKEMEDMRAMEDAFPPAEEQKGK